MNDRKVARYRGLFSRLSAQRKHNVQVRRVQTPKVRPCTSVISAWEKTATRSAQMSKKPNQTEARRREPTSMSHQPSGGTPFFLFPSAGMAPPPVAMLPRCTTGGVAWSGVAFPQPHLLVWVCWRPLQSTMWERGVSVVPWKESLV